MRSSKSEIHGNLYAMRFKVLQLSLTNEMHMRQVRLSVTGSNFFGTNNTGAAQGDRAGTTQPLTPISCRQKHPASIFGFTRPPQL